MASAQLFKQRWLQTKRANDRHAQQVRNLRASLRAQAAPPAPRVARGGGGGGGTNTNGGTNGGTDDGGGDT
jgi:hypothetical protein